MSLITHVIQSADQEALDVRAVFEPGSIVRDTLSIQQGTATSQGTISRTDVHFIYDQDTGEIHNYTRMVYELQPGQERLDPFTTITRNGARFTKSQVIPDPEGIGEHFQHDIDYWTTHAPSLKPQLSPKQADTLDRAILALGQYRW